MNTTIKSAVILFVEWNKCLLNGSIVLGTSYNFLDIAWWVRIVSSDSYWTVYHWSQLTCSNTSTSWSCPFDLFEKVQDILNLLEKEQWVTHYNRDIIWQCCPTTDIFRTFLFNIKEKDWLIASTCTIWMYYDCTGCMTCDIIWDL